MIHLQSMTRVGRSEHSDLRYGNPIKAYLSEVAMLAPTYSPNLRLSRM
ncbi:MAG: hypothetical protein OXD54_06095 [Candidatus Poribacteria bacterium]|nr:hypothetical protein [Candidatus Poribacteria bacterium]